MARKQVETSIAHVRKTQPKMLKFIQAAVPKLKDDELTIQIGASGKLRRTVDKGTTAWHIHNLAVELSREEKKKRAKGPGRSTPFTRRGM